jgi:hypothetical protein
MHDLTARLSLSLLQPSRSVHSCIQYIEPVILRIKWLNQILSHILHRPANCPKISSCTHRLQVHYYRIMTEEINFERPCKDIKTVRHIILSCLQLGRIKADFASRVFLRETVNGVLPESLALQLRSRTLKRHAGEIHETKRFLAVVCAPQN